MLLILMLLLLLSAPAPAACRRAWKLTRTLAEGAALLLAGAWRRSPADLQTSFVPLAGAALERQVGGEGVEGRCCLLRDELLRPCTLMVSMCCCSCAALPQEAVAVLGRMMALTGCDDDLGRLVVPLLRDTLASQTSGAGTEAYAAAAHSLAGIAVCCALSNRRWGYDQVGRCHVMVCLALFCSLFF